MTATQDDKKATLRRLSSRILDIVSPPQPERDDPCMPNQRKPELLLPMPDVGAWTSFSGAACAQSVDAVDSVGWVAAVM